MRKELDISVIQQGLKDDDCDVRQAAMNACHSLGIEIPRFRTIEPPEKVIKCDVCGKVLKPEEVCYKAFLKERYYCELHDMIGKDLDEDKWR